MKKTKLNNDNYLLYSIIYFVIGVVFLLLPIMMYSLFMNAFGDFQFFKVLLIILIIFSSLFVLLFFILSFKMLLGFLKGKINIGIKENKYKLSNPYIYFRDLPNNYGIGVSTLLIDSAIENYKDIIAVILDLCAKKYLKLTKDGNLYKLGILKTIDDNLLINEKYILELIISKNITNIDYNKWYQLCLEDGINLGLYEKKNTTVNKNLINNYPGNNKFLRVVTNIALIIGIIVGLISYYNKLDACTILHLDSQSNPNYLVSAFVISFLTFAIIVIGISIFYAIYITILRAYDFGKQFKNMSYKHTLFNNLTKTEKGIEEVQKLYAFKNFIQDFGNLVNKNIEEVILWDRYLSYAQMFDITKEIMKNGYNKLINNNSFVIDNIDNINLENIKIV